MPTAIYRRLYERLILYDADGTAVEARGALVAGSPSGDPLIVTPTREVRGDGQEREVARMSAFEFATSERHVIEQVRAWIEAGTSVKAVAVGSGLLAQWDQSAVPVEVDRPTGPLTLDGPVFRLTSALRRAAVYRSADLLAPLKAGGAAWSTPKTRIIPVPSSPYAKPLTLWLHSADGDEVTITAYDHDDLQLGTATEDTPGSDGSTTAALACPVGTWYVKVETDGATWPELFARAPVPVTIVTPSGGGCTPPPAPENLAGSEDSGGVLWTWDAVAVADGYTLRLGDTEGGPYEEIVELALADLADPDNPSYLDADEYLYAVVAAWQTISS